MLEKVYRKQENIKRACAFLPTTENFRIILKKILIQTLGIFSDNLKKIWEYFNECQENVVKCFGKIWNQLWQSLVQLRKDF